MKVLTGTFNKNKAIVGAFSVIVTPQTLRRFVSISSVGSGAVLTSAEHCSRHSYTLPIRLALNMFAELWSLIKWRSWQGVAKNLHTSSSPSPLSICDHYCRINQPQFETKCYGSELAKPRHNLLTWLAKLFAQSHTTHQLLTTPTVFGNEELTDGQLGFFHHLKAKSFWQVKKCVNYGDSEWQFIHGHKMLVCHVFSV